MIYDLETNFSITKLYLKLILPFAIIIFIITSIFIYFIRYNLFIDSADTQVNEVLEFCAIDIENCFNSYFNLAQNYNNMFKEYHTMDKSYRRDFYNSLTKSFIEKNLNIKSIWADFDKNKFDSSDAQYINTPYYTTEGKFNVRWNRNIYQINLLKFQKYSDLENQYLSQPYITIPKTKKKPALTLNEISDTITFTFSSPVFDKNNNVVGVTGIDVYIAQLEDMLDKSKINLIFSYSLLTSDGLIFSHHNPELVGKNIKENILYTNNFNPDSILKKMSENENVIIKNVIHKKTGDTLTLLYYRIKMQEEIKGTILYVCIVLKNDAVSINTASFFTVDIAIYCFILLVLVCIGIIFISIAIDNMFLNKMIVEIDKREIAPIDNI